MNRNQKPLSIDPPLGIHPRSGNIPRRADEMEYNTSIQNDAFPLAGNTLTTQEINIAVLVSQGKTNSEIAGTLFIAPGTVRNYVSSILSKTYLPNRAALAVYAVQNDLRGQAVRVYQDGPVPYNPDCYKDLLSMAIM